MYHPFKALEASWNARTPVWLHNRTKENLIFQLIATALLLVGFVAYDEYTYRRDYPEAAGRLKAYRKNRRRNKK